jgi:dihydropteroate synthase
MGIVNITPDSFYDGGAREDPESAVRHALRLLEQGAHILDLGAASSRPGAREVSPEEEQARLLPVLRGLRALPPGRAAAVSVDTCRASTARLALEAGADIINDISACAFDPELLDALVESKPGYVLMHCGGRPADMRESPRYADVVDEVLHFFEKELMCLCAAGLAEQSIVLDPGIGFGKSLEETTALLRGISRLRGLRAHPPGREATVSVDTCRASTARLALEAGADIINDISACAFAPELLDTLVEYKPGYVLMHCRGRPADMRHSPRYADVVDEALHFFEKALARLCAAGLAEQNIVLDPGIGFGKRLEDNTALLRGIARLRGLGRPILAGLSMKSLFGDLLGLPLERRGPATQVATALLAVKGVVLHRVHDVPGALEALRLAQTIG